VDVFAAADQEAMDKAENLKLLDSSSRRNFASNTLVLIKPADSKLALGGVRDLAQPGVQRIASGNPASVPAGRYAPCAGAGRLVERRGQQADLR
jgi:molybdate transport system substrate-binding protein